MKKGISKVLSVMCSVTVLSGMLSMNSVGAVRLIFQEVVYGLSIMCNYCRNPPNSISDDGINIDNKKFMAKIICKLDKAFEDCSGKNLQALQSEFIKEIFNPNKDVEMDDQESCFFNLLIMHLLSVAGSVSIRNEDPENVRVKFILFKYAIQYMIGLVENLSQRKDITKDDRKKCVEAINLTIENINFHSIIASDVSYIQDIYERIVLYYKPGVLSQKEETKTETKAETSWQSWGCTLL